MGLNVWVSYDPLKFRGQGDVLRWKMESYIRFNVVSPPNSKFSFFDIGCLF